MRVLLAAPPHRDTFGYSMPPPGLLRLGGELRRRSIDVQLEDLAFRLACGELEHGDALAERAADVLLARGARDVVGLSVMGATLPMALAMAGVLRERGYGGRVLLGGPGTTGIDSALIERFPAIDAVVRGEGEETLPELLGAWARGAQPAGVAGVTWRDERGRARREPERPPMRDLFGLAQYAWDLLPPIAAYKRVTGEEEGLVPLDSGRGCVYDCSFCTIGRFWGRRSRALPAQRLADEIAALRDMPGAKRAYLCHDIFGADRAHALDLCRALAERGAGVAWECRARADHLGPELVEAMGRAGCVRVLLGIESADGGVRNRNGKSMDERLDVLDLVERLDRAGITPILSCILGLPGEGERELRATLDLCLAASLRAGVNVSLHLVNPQPGCGLGDEHGPTSRPIEGIPPDMALGTGDSAPERALIAAHPGLFSTWSLLTGLPGGEARLRELRAIAAELPPVLMRFPRAFALLARLRGADAHDLFGSWRASGASFEAFARAAGDARVNDCLTWEDAIARVGARGWSPPGPVRAVLVEARCDLPSLARQLARAQDLPPAPWPTDGAAGAYAVLRGPRGVRTLRLSAAAARALRARAAGESLPAEIERQLAAADLVAAPEGRARDARARAPAVS